MHNIKKHLDVLWSRRRSPKYLAVLAGLVIIIAGSALLLWRHIQSPAKPSSSRASTLAAAATVAPPLPNTPTPSPSPSSEATTAPGAPVSQPTAPPAPAQSAPLENPATVLGLANWYLTIPVVDNSTGNAAEIKQPELANYTSPYFYTIPGNVGVDFRAYANGATTANSQYPRSELREMANNGADMASWSTTSGVNMMSVTESIDHLPDVKPQVVFAQIHGPSAAVIEAEISGFDGHNRLYVKNNGTQYGTDFTDNYILGTKFTLEIVAAAGYVNVYFNGQRFVHEYLPSSGDYFKAGCYTQSNTSKGDSPSAYGQVSIYNIAVSHT